MTSKHDETVDQNGPSEQEPDMHGAAIIDENGNEIAITDAMVRESLDKLEHDLEEEESKDIR